MKQGFLLLTAFFLRFGLLNAEEAQPWTGPLFCLPNVTEEEISQILEGKRGDVAIECPEGLRLPLNLRISGDFFSLENGAAPTLVALKTLYLRCPEPETFLFSTDLVTWKDFSHFFTGTFLIGFSTKEGGPVANLELELNPSGYDPLEELEEFFKDEIPS